MVAAFLMLVAGAPLTGDGLVGALVAAAEVPVAVAEAVVLDLAIG